MSSRPSNIPIELLDNIIEFTTAADQISLCRVCKVFYSSATRRLYRRIELSCSCAVVKCCRTLSSNIDLASQVDDLTLSENRPLNITSVHLYAYYNLLSKAFRNLTRLEHLRLAIRYDKGYGFALFQHTFPYLQSLSVDLPLSEGFATFLNRHQSLISLQLSPFQLSAADKGLLTTMEPIYLPRLLTLTGSAAYAPFIARSASLTNSALTWDIMVKGNDQGSSFNEVIKTLEITSKETIRFMALTRRGWNVDLLDELSKTFPRLSVVTVNNILMPSEDTIPEPDVLDSVAAALSRFTDLTEFRYNVTAARLCPTTNNNVDASLQTVIAWGKVCPTMRICTAFADVQWKRVGQDAWVPSDGSAPGVIAWMVQMFQSKRYPCWEKILVALEQRITILSLLQADPRSEPTEASTTFTEQLSTLGDSSNGIATEIFFNIPRLLAVTKRFRDCEDPLRNACNTQEILILGIFLKLWEYDAILPFGKQIGESFPSPQELAYASLM